MEMELSGAESPHPSVTVYVVDDDEAVRDSLKLLLESYGLGVESYDSPVAFAAGASLRHPCCLILDQHLSRSTGLDFLASPAGAKLSLPVILITGQGDAAIRASALRLGVAAYLEKPMDEDALLAAIRSATTASC